MALVGVTGLESAGFPELGTAVFEFNDHCDGQARIYVATGMYAGANGQSISFLLLKFVSVSENLLNLFIFQSSDIA